MHHNYMISTFWWTLLWLVVTAPLWLFLFAPGVIAWTHHRPLVPVPLRARLAALFQPSTAALTPPP